MLGLAVLGGVASAALAPQATAISEERGGHGREKLEAVLDALVEDGTIDEAQRDAILAKLAAAGPKDGERRKDEEKREQAPKLRFDIHRLLTNWFARAVEFIGLERRELGERLRAGDTLLEIALDEDKTEAGLIDAISAPGLEKIAALVEEHELSAEQEAALKERLAAAVEKAITREFPAKPRAAEAPKKTERGNAPAKTPRENPGKRP